MKKQNVLEVANNFEFFMNSTIEALCEISKCANERYEEIDSCLGTMVTSSDADSIEDEYGVDVAEKITWFKVYAPETLFRVKDLIEKALQECKEYNVGTVYAKNEFVEAVNEINE